MAIAFRASTEAHTTTGSLTVTIPAAVQAGDVMLLIGGMNDAGVPANDWTTPAGWTAIDMRRTGADVFAAAWVRVAQSGDPGSTVTLETSSTGKSCVVLAAYSGADPVAPVNVSAAESETTTTASHTTPTVTTTVTNARIVIAAVQQDSETQSWGTATGYTKRQDSIDNDNLGGHVSATVQDKAVVDVGTYGGEAIVAAAEAGKAVMYTIALAPMSATQVSRPISDITATGVTGVPTPGEGSGIYARIGGTTDSDYAQYSNGGVLQVGMAAMIDPLASGGHTLRFRACYAAGAAGGTITTTLKDGATVIAEWADNLTADFTDYSHTLTAAEADAITDYSALTVMQTVTLS